MLSICGNMPSACQKQKELTKVQKRYIKYYFDLFGMDGSGEIDSIDLVGLMRALGFEPNKQEIQNMAPDIFGFGSGRIGYEEFLNAMAHKILEDESAGVVPVHDSLWQLAEGRGPQDPRQFSMQFSQLQPASGCHFSRMCVEKWGGDPRTPKPASGCASVGCSAL